MKIEVTPEELEKIQLVATERRIFDSQWKDKSRMGAWADVVYSFGECVASKHFGVEWTPTIDSKPTGFPVNGIRLRVTSRPDVLVHFNEWDDVDQEFLAIYVAPDNMYGEVLGTYKLADHQIPENKHRNGWRVPR